MKIIRELSLFFLTFTLFISCKNKQIEIGQKKTKLVFENIKPVIKHLEVISIMTFNEQGNITLDQTRDCKITYEYDNNGNLIHESKVGKNFRDSMDDLFYESLSVINPEEKNNFKKTPTDYEIWYEYDKQGNQIHVLYSYGDEYFKEYDSNGNQIHLKGPDNYEIISEYDKNNNLISEKTLPYNTEIKNKYDAHKHLIYSQSINEYFTGETWYSYDSYGKLISKKTNNGTETRYEYNSTGKLIHEYNVNEENSDTWYDYDKNGNKTYYLASFGIEEINKYNKKGNVTYTRMDSGYALTETFNKYTYYPNGHIKEKIQYSAN